MLRRNSMPKIGTPFDDVSGQIVGGNYGQAWVTYEGRKQGPTCYPTSYHEADEMCSSIVARIKSECGYAFKEIYPKEAWMFHFDGI